MGIVATKLLYLSIILICTCFAFRSQRIIASEGAIAKTRFKSVPFIISGLLAWVFLAFTNIGVDYNSYYMIAYRSSWETYNKIISVEPGFALLCATLKSIVGSNPDAVIFIMKSLQILLTFISIYMLKEKIDVGYAVFAFMTLVYLPSFYLISIVLAGSVVLFAMSLMIKRDKYLIPLLIIILAAQLHNAVYLFLPSYIAIWILNKNKNLSRIYRVLILVGYIGVSFFASQLFAYFQNNIAGFHYSNYELSSTGGSGLMVMVMYAPLAYLVFRMSQYDIATNTLNEIYVLSITSFLFNILSYQFRVIERMELIIAPLYVLLLPEVLFDSGVIKREGPRKNKTIVHIIYIAYMVFRAYLVFTSRTTVQSGMSQYHFFMPF